MADESTASVIPLHTPAPKKARKGGERAKTPRPRKKKPEAPEAAPPPSDSEHLIPLEFLSAHANDDAPPPPATASGSVSDATAEVPHSAAAVATSAATPTRPIASYVLAVAA